MKRKYSKVVNINLKLLVDKMTPYMRSSLEGAAGLCLTHNQFNVEIEHWLLKLLDISDTDIVQLLVKHEIDQSKLARELAKAIAGFAQAVVGQLLYHQVLLMQQKTHGCWLL